MFDVVEGDGSFGAFLPMSRQARFEIGAASAEDLPVDSDLGLAGIDDDLHGGADEEPVNVLAA